MDARNSLLGGDPTFDQNGAQYHHRSFSQSGDYGAEYGQAYPQASLTQAAYAQPTYTENASLHQNTETAGAAGSTGASRFDFSFVKSRWPAAFLAVTGIQALINLAFEAYVFGKFQLSLGAYVPLPQVQSQYKTIPTFLTLFIFGFLYELILVLDALRMKNTIQIIGVCVANLALLIYSALQLEQIQMALGILEVNGALEQGITSAMLWDDIKAYLIATPVIIAVTTIIMVYITWKLYQQFAWDILKNIGADYRMKKRFLHYQIYIALLKFDFFFFLGFIIQFVVVVAVKTDPEFALTIATIPVTIAILIAAAFFTQRENKPGMICVIVLYFGGLSYFIFKLFRIYEPSRASSYFAVRKSLTAFAVITILLIIMTIINAIICMHNFGSGLKAHLLSARKEDEKNDVNSFGMNDVKSPMQNRMTID
ncbi:uncharacterized protein TrAtP1_006378 [Trichoderma atroviride]|uniref:Uncharacterized protein n=1 Tax=Hypocrea atroviridis (strain ATCC 20476 / IMI 206040) TaxID=452589 RepID=G9P9H4_HYPAI|nr:uncharacterized protein TRIATDRAFT_302694 [Trichoderma atroviride IMI 206040]EHK40297.1 hypothetical protein TRIATDRAFT_302694 [Trichoderma atroviride IMI 206040]KAK1254900.1 hypothetical protein MKX08_008895 [Trichoderma sp. CBMAI-0020]UKZ65183.1 hypothetical protein TrAtP1_006378 [Trichoderma atroviride]